MALIQTATRFAPSTTGPPHLGTLLSGLLCYLHARREGSTFVVRMENLDRERCKPEFLTEMLAMLEDFGLSPDKVDIQSEHLDDYRIRLNHLAQQGYIYFCNCSRARLKASANRGPDGSFIYDNRCRENLWLPGQSIQDGSLRCRLPTTRLTLDDNIAGSRVYETQKHFGDPIIVRRDGAFSYHFSSVVDDARVGITDVVRGRDLIDSTATQLVLRKIMNLPIPKFFHHLLLMEGTDRKLAKLHGSIPVRELRKRLTVESIYGSLAYFLGFAESEMPLNLSAFQKLFTWETVSRNDVLVHYDEDKGELVSQKL